MNHDMGGISAGKGTALTIVPEGAFSGTVGRVPPDALATAVADPFFRIGYAEARGSNTYALAEPGPIKAT